MRNPLADGWLRNNPVNKSLPFSSRTEFFGVSFLCLLVNLYGIVFDGKVEGDAHKNAFTICATEALANNGAL